jgi:long-subunit acyl-CoA synthetase (AMP-forming)
VAYPTSAEISSKLAGQTVASTFLDTVTAHPDRVALRWRDGDGWDAMTYRAYADAVARVAAGMRDLGVAPGDRVVLMLRNVPEFHVLDIAVVMCGATPISIYNSSSVEQVAYLAGHSRARFAFVEDDEFFGAFRAARPSLPELRTVGVVRGSGGDVGYDEMLGTAPLELHAAAAAVRPDHLATVIYTSGTTGDPKGVMLTHEQVRFTAESLKIALGRSLADLAGTRVVSYLPMAHVAERMTSHYSGILAAYEVITCPDVGQIAAYLRAVRPQVFFGVPRVWEKIQSGLLAALAADPDKLRQFEDGVAAAIPLADARSWGRATEEQEATLAFLDEVAFAPVRSTLGIDEVFCAVSGAAPIPPELLAWYRGIGVPLSEIYGMSESGGPMLWAPQRVKPGTVGPPIPGCEVRLAPDGEILCRGGNVFEGYLDDPVRTAEALDSDGWLHSGDIGTIDDDGYYRVVDRKKELIITAGGKNVSPANLEAKLKLVPLIGQAIAVGDNEPFVSALLVLDPEAARVFARAEGIDDTDLAALARNPRVVEVVTAGVDTVMASFSHAEQVKRFVILADEWEPDSVELTPTSKLKRRNIAEKYAAEIASMYAAVGPAGPASTPAK